MRERWAILLAALTALLMVAMSALFARVQNPPAVATPAVAQTPGPAAAPAPDSVVIERGRSVFREQGCSSCHSAAGEGFGSSLDGVAERRSAAELRAWITGDDSLRGQASDGLLALKQRYRGLAVEDLDALVAFLSASRPQPD
ncbi:MAG: cytochrome c [Chromatiales bacterium]|nr:cytochrome c [Chromatiales bacterium]